MVPQFQWILVIHTRRAIWEVYPIFRPITAWEKVPTWTWLNDTSCGYESSNCAQRTALVGFFIASASPWLIGGSSTLNKYISSLIIIPILRLKFIPYPNSIDILHSHPKNGFSNTRWRTASETSTGDHPSLEVYPSVAKKGNFNQV